MTFDLRPDQAHASLVLTTSGEVGRDEAQTILNSLIRYLDRAARPTHILVDCRDLTQLPGLIPILFNVFQLMLHPKLGWIAFVWPPPVALSMIAAVLYRIQFRHRVFPTMAEARQFLMHVKQNEG
jgi:hypothetical protein